MRRCVVDCWAQNPAERPDFSVVVTRLRLRGGGGGSRGAGGGGGGGVVVTA